MAACESRPSREGGVWECGLGGLRAKKGMKINCPGTGSREKGIFGRILWGELQRGR